MKFDDPKILDQLSSAEDEHLDAAPFGIVRMDHDGKILAYSSGLTAFTDITKTESLGKHFFTEIAPCTNNFMVSQRYSDSEALDEEMDYTFTLKMAPTPVRLRMLKDDTSQYLLVKAIA